MELITLSLGFIINTFAKNKAVHSAVDDFVSGSVNWVRGWFVKNDNASLVKELEDEPESEEVKNKMNDTMTEMIKNPQFKDELEKWVKEYQKPNPTMKNVLEDVDINVQGNVQIGDKTSDGQKYDQKNVIKRGKIKAGGDFILGD